MGMAHSELGNMILDTQEADADIAPLTELCLAGVPQQARGGPPSTAKAAD